MVIYFLVPKWGLSATYIFQMPKKTEEISMIGTDRRYASAEENIYLLPAMTLCLFYRRKFCYVVNYLGKGHEVKSWFEFIRNNPQHVLVCLSTL